MTTKETEAEILRRFHVEKWLVGTIASKLHVHHSTVQRIRLADPLCPWQTGKTSRGRTIASTTSRALGRRSSGLEPGSAVGDAQRALLRVALPTPLLTS